MRNAQTWPQAPETLGELLDRAHILLNEIPVPGKNHGGSRSKLWCPQCQGGKEREKNFFVAIDRDGYGATWLCFRANNCGFSGGGRIKGAPEREQEKPRNYKKPRPEPRPERPSKLVEYYSKFGIAEQTLEDLNIYRTERRMPVLKEDGKQDGDRTTLRSVIAFPYYEDGELVNVKYKAVYDGGRKRFLQEWNAKPTLFNIDSFEHFGADDWGIIVEGEDDVAALWHCGWRQVTTLPDGAPDKIRDLKEFDRDNDKDKRYAPLYGEPKVDKIRVWILAGDMDAAGARHHEELARRLGKGRCKLVSWPGTCKDAKETLQKHGLSAVNHAIENADFYPLEGMYRANDDDIRKAYDGVHDARITTGVYSIDERLCLNDAGQLIITTGISGRGKTTFWNAMATLYAEENTRLRLENPAVRPFHTVLCSAEMNPLLMTTRLLAQHAKAPFRPHSIIPRMSLDTAQSLTGSWVNRHFSFIKWPKRSTQPTLSWAYDRFEEVILRTGAKLAILDPWQEFDDEMPDRERNQSNWIGKCLQRWIGLAEATRCNIVIVTHPRKVERNKEGKARIPEGDDIADSRHFNSRCDIGITIHRPDDGIDDMLIWVWKQRDPLYSHYGTTTVRYDQATHRLFAKPIPIAEDEPVQHWQETDAG